MKTIKISISLSANVLEATDATVKEIGEKSRSAFIERALRENPEVYENLQRIREANKD